MKTVLLLFISALCSCSLTAQQTVNCVQRLFALKEGLSKEAVYDSVKNIYGVEPVSGYTKKNTETVIYTVRSEQCFNGRSAKLQFEYINNKLQKAYLQTTFARTDYYDMLDNFNAIRNIIKPYWEREKEIRLSLDNLVSTGYSYSKAKQSKSQTDKISLQYISTKPDKGYGIYLVQLTWVNADNTGIETISY